MNYCVCDLESTCWNERTPHKRTSEIIEIGACCVNNNNQVISEFQSFVKPVRFAELSDFCKELTHIEQTYVDTAKEFSEVMIDFTKWVKENNIAMWGSWGKYDFTQFLQDCYYHQIVFPYLMHINLKPEVCFMIGENDMGLDRAVKHLGLEFEGIQHRALTDSRNIVRVLEKVNWDWHEVIKNIGSTI